MFAYYVFIVLRNSEYVFLLGRQVQYGLGNEGLEHPEQFS